MESLWIVVYSTSLSRAGCVKMHHRMKASQAVQVLEMEQDRGCSDTEGLGVNGVDGEPSIAFTRLEPLQG